MKQNQPIPYPFPEKRLLRSSPEGQREWVELQEEVRQRHQAGENLNLSALQRHHPQLLERVYALYPCPGWRGLLEAAGLSYDVIGKEVRAEVSCPLCDFKGESLTGHLRHKHRISPEEFHRRFPDAEIAGDLFRSKMRLKGRGPTIPHWELFSTPHYFVDRLIHYHQLGYQINASVMNHLDRPMITQLSRWKWSFPKFVELIGLEEKEKETPGEGVKEEVESLDFDPVEFACRVQELKEDLNTVRLKSFQARYPELARKAYVYYGNWLKAMEAVGDDNRHLIRERQQSEEVKKERDEQFLRLTELDGAAHYQRWRELRALYSRFLKVKAQRERTGLATHLGVDPFRLTPAYSVRTPDRALDVLASLLREDPEKFPTQQQIRFAHPVVSEALEKFFGSIDKAREALPFDAVEEGVFWSSADLRRFLLKHYADVNEFNPRALAEGSPLERRLALGLSRHHRANIIQFCRELNLPIHYKKIKNLARQKRVGKYEKKDKSRSPQEVLDELRGMAEQGLSLQVKDFVSPRPKYLRAEFMYFLRKHFKTPFKAMEAAELAKGRRLVDSPHLSRLLFFTTPESVLLELRWRHQHGLSVRRNQVQADETSGGAFFVHRALKLFGSWKEVLQAAGIEVAPQPVKKAVPPSRESILAELSEWLKEGVPFVSAVAVPQLRKTSRYRDLWKKASFHFSSWPEMVDTYYREVIRPGKSADHLERNKSVGPPGEGQ